MDKELDEPVLPNDYPVYPGYLYVVDGKVIRSERHTTVGRLKRLIGASEVRRCDIAAREKEDKKKWVIGPWEIGP